MIHYLMYIDTHGDISQIRIAKGVNPTDRAVDPEVGQYCVHYMEALSDIGAFHASKVWNYTTEQWDTRALRPNYHAVWENGAWTWNVHTLLQDIRVERNNRLAFCDWTIANDSPLSDSQKTEATTYRTALRNLPSSITIADIDSVENTPWPAIPSFLG
jgi:hypothetical protein